MNSAAERRPITQLCCALLTLALASSLHAQPPTSEARRARALNGRGLALHAAGKLEEGLAAFQQAVELDPDYAVAHYNLACALSRLRAANKVCEVNAYRSTILEHLERAIALDGRRRARARTDADLQSIRDTLGYQRLVLQRRLDRDADRRVVLLAVSWYGPSPGAYGPSSGVTFAEDGTVTGWQLAFDDEGAPRREPWRGRFSVKGGSIELQLEGTPAPLKATLAWDGLVIDGLGRFSDDPDDCSA